MGTTEPSPQTVDQPTESTAHDDSDTESVEEMKIDVAFHGKISTLQVPVDSTISYLSSLFSNILAIDPTKQKILITPKPGLLKHPFPDTPLVDVLTPKSKITLLGSTNKEIDTLNTAIASSRLLQLRGGSSALKTTTPSKYRDWRKIQEEAQYTFHMIHPLPYLPNPERSTRFLERLRDDPGVRAAMRTHKFSVPLLTEMNPAEHTTHDSKTLGLNRNKGEVIELRLRTDAYDGYRDYKVIRKTLCHELAHCVWSDHDRNFWDLTNQIEKEVERADWKHGGNRLTSDEIYNPDDTGEEGQFDHGGWTGGEFVLGSSEGTRPEENEGLSRREILAKAAINRMNNQKGNRGLGTGKRPSPDTDHAKEGL